MDCEVCGRRQASTKSKIEGAVLNVCGSCVSLGAELIENKVYYSSDGGRAKAPTTFASNATSTPTGASAPRSMGELELVEDCGKRVGKARQAMGLSPEQLGQKLSLNVDYIKQIESGKRHPDQRTARKLEAALKIRLFE